jgi:uncharacterized LabA/DUF88 family protein
MDEKTTESKLNRIAVFVDIRNLYYNTKREFNKKINYGNYLKKFGENVVKACAFGLLYDNDSGDFISALKHIGYEVEFQKSEHLHVSDRTKRHMLQNEECSNRMIVGILRCLDKIDTVIVGSSNKNILPFIYLLKEQGVHVQVFACSIPNSIKRAATSYVEIGGNILEEQEIAITTRQGEEDEQENDS